MNDVVLQYTRGHPWQTVRVAIAGLTAETVNERLTTGFPANKP